MALEAGVKLGVYEVAGALGAGGMGEVYRARDTRLGRDVALKVLPPAFAQDPDRMARFAREAQVLASLNHPNIAQIYGLEDGAGAPALVMELVEGPTLAERIAAGPIPLEEALPLAKGIADALEYAHERGVVHRDLKPANIKINGDGHAKLLDFGLAKAMSSESTVADPEASPTLTMRATAAGVILGTAGYMAPEQARGAEVDKRADIWAFGVVLFEMLTGRHTFAGETVTDTLAAVLRADLQWTTLPDQTPAAIRRMLRRCLERERKRRMRDIGDAVLEIEEALAAPAEPPPASPARNPQRWWPVATALVAVGGLAIALIHFRESPPDSRPVLFTVGAPENAQFGVGTPFRLALSPDGRLLAFTASKDGRVQIWLRPLDSLEARPLAGTETAGFIFWSPDSRWIAFPTAEGKLKKMEVTGGPPQTLCSLPGGSSMHGAWGPDGTILFGTFPAGGGLWRVSQAGGDVTRVTKLDAGRQERAHSFPRFLPDGRHFIYAARSEILENNCIYLASLDGKQNERLLNTPTTADFAPPVQGQDSGHLLFLREGSLMAQPLDPKTFRLAGESFPVAESVGTFLSYGLFSASANGVLAYQRGRSSAAARLMWFDREGKALGTVGPPGGYSNLSLSLDGTRVAVTQLEAQTSNLDIWLVDVARGVPQRFTFDPDTGRFAVWSPDSGRIAFASSRNGVLNIYLKPSGGIGNAELLLKSSAPSFPLDWSRDGKLLLYQQVDPNTRGDLWVLPMEPGMERKPMPFLQTPFDESLGQFCPAAGSQWVAYQSDESGRFEIYAQPFSGGSSTTAGKFQISTGGGEQPRWRADGKELFYLAPDGRLMAVDVKTSPRFQTGVPTPLIDAPALHGVGRSAWGYRYAVAPDGKRFLVTIAQEDRSTATPITVVLNWPAAMKR